MQLIKRLIGVLIGGSILLLVGCASSKDVLYLQGVENPSMTEFELLSPVVQPGDLLAITVNSDNPELSAPFNLPMVSYASNTGRGLGIQYLQGHLVGKDGALNFPLLGKINAAGLTKQQLVEKIERELKAGSYLKDPIVTITFLNFKVSVLGEVSRPGTFNIENERVTILSAISMAGDLTIYGRRDNVIVIREENGKRMIVSHDLRSPDIFQSPCYFLKQNDVVLVSPNKTKAQMSSINQNSNVGVWVSIVGSTTSVATLVATLVRYSQSSNK